MGLITTEDGTRLINGISQARPAPPTRRRPPTSADPREHCPYEDRADRDHRTFMRLARAL